MLSFSRVWIPASGMTTKKTRSYIRMGAAGLLILAAILFFTHCSTVSYLSQAAGGQIRIMTSSKPISRIRPGTQDSVSMQKLRMVLQIRTFASEALGLPQNRSYTAFAKVKRDYLGWNVYCAPRFSVEPKRWCFPIAGCVVYKGYFNKDKAVGFADSLKKAGYDVFVSPFSGYSTLGWFRDPILSTQLDMDSMDLAGLIIHELAHQKLYKKGDSEFSESFAVTVEREGVVRWFRSLGRSDQAEKALKVWEEEDRRVEQILKTRSELEILYGSGKDSLTLQRQKDSVFLSLEKFLYGTGRKGVVLNNAFIAPIHAYHSWVPEFKKLLEECGGDLEKFYLKTGAGK